MIQELYARQNKGGTPTLFTGSDFQNYGYWADGTQTLDVACDNLVQLLLSFLPEPPKRIVDVGCGKGAATARLRHHLPDADITGIDFSESQLSQARSKHPDLRFEHMDAGHMGLGEGSLDALISMDTMHQIMTREAFLEEAKRLLAPGGTLVFSDLLLASEAPVQPPANFIEDAQSYAALGLKAGFDRVEVFDTTEQSWAVFSEYQLFTAGQRADRGEIRPEEVWLTRTWMQQNAPKACVVGWMRKA
ncbi:MAG: methyltransferase domain-containing protein [Marinibacterium sp.]